MGRELVVDLARTQQDAPDSLLGRIGRVGDDLAEVARGELLRPTAGSGQSEQRLRGERDQGLADAPSDLPPQQVEVLGGGRGDDHLDVVAGGELEESLDPAAGVLRSLALIAVRQQQHQPAGLAPFVLAGHDELVHDDLGLVDEVSELGLPHHQGVLRHDGLAVLKPQGGELVQRTVVDQEGPLILGQVGQRIPLALGSMVDQHRVALAERPAS